MGRVSWPKAWCGGGKGKKTEVPDMADSKWEQKGVRARPGFEPGTSRTLSENHTPRPTSLALWPSWLHPSSTAGQAPPQGQMGVEELHLGAEEGPKLPMQRRLKKHGMASCFRPGSNRRPCACEAHVITTTLRKPLWQADF